MGGILFPGTNMVTVKIQNCHSMTSDSRTVNFNPIATGTRFNFLGMDVTQAIQDMSHSVPHIADKRTFVRVYFNLTGPTNQLNEVSGVLSVYKSPGANRGGEFIGSVSSLNTMPLLDSSDIVVKRSTYPDGALNFEIPQSWTNIGQIHFTVTPYIEGRMQGSTASLVPCEDIRLTQTLRVFGCDNIEPFSTAGLPIPHLDFFNSVPPVRIKIIGIPYTVGGVTITPRQIDFDLLSSWLRRAYPTGPILAQISTNSGTGYNGLPTCNQVDTDLLNRWVYDVVFGNTDTRTRYYGVVSDNSGSNFMRGCAPGSPSAVASGPAGADTRGWDFDGSYGDWYGGHEIGHMYGREHVGIGDSCDSTPTGVDPNYPYPDGLISKGNQHFGFDVGDSSNSITPSVKHPNNWTDVMSYRCRQWVSDYTYNGILSNLVSSGPSMALINANSSNLTQLTPIATERNLTLFVLGNLNINKSTVELKPFTLLPASLSTSKMTLRPINGSFSIDLLGSNGNLLARYPFEPKNYTDRLSGEDQLASIAELVPYVPGVKQIAVSKDSKMLASRNVSANTPDIQLTSPKGGETFGPNENLTLKWNSSDADNDKLTYSLLYSIDDGRQWQTIITGINGSTYTVSLTDLPGSDRALFRVIASDGVNTAVFDSDRTFRVESKAPQVHIISPEDSSRLSTGQNITFTGEAFDLEDGLLDGRSLRWSSDKQGNLGFGRSISVDGLSPGLHEITLSAMDTIGNINTRQHSLGNITKTANCNCWP